MLYIFRLINFIILGFFAVVIAALHIILMITRDYSLTGILKPVNILPPFLLPSSFATADKFYYALYIIFTMLTLGAIGLNKLVTEDNIMKRKILRSKDESFTFSKDVLCGWDNSMLNDSDVADSYGLTAQTLREKLSESKSRGIQSTRTTAQLVKLYSRRVLGTLLYLAFQVASYATIIYLKVKSIQIAVSLQNVLPSFVGTLIVPAAITFINSASPVIFQTITDMENWYDDKQIIIKLFEILLFLKMHVYVCVRACCCVGILGKLV